MNFRKFVVPVGLAILFYAAHRSYGWMGVAAVGGGTVMWLLLHFTRLMTIVRRASNQPIGYVGSAIMLNVKLKPKVSLMHVIAMTRSLGQRMSEEGQDPEIFRWTDGTNSHVTCEFVGGRLMKWTLQRPPQPEATATDAAQAPAALPPVAH
ncbi:glycerate kinase [Comamonas sp. CMM03]|jgi:hypothetical protein|uniref:glycerate kinase n=1 Tax=Comamonas TaxID=283 RepID=UPI001C456F3C|nr:MULTISPECIES: glycerate kinase [Comamonas]MBV7419280.1 glycerate kinase [Comamonas sp. CMM03]